jgi:hypothetical protein
LRAAADIAELEGFEIDEELLGDEGLRDEDEASEDDDIEDEGVAVDEDDLPGKAKKGRQRKLTDHDKIQAFRAGKLGFTEGREVRDWPKSLSPDLYNDWSCGWRVAHAEEQQGAGASVCCIFPADLRDIGALDQVYRDRWRAFNVGRESLSAIRASFPALPWDMQSLRSTTWRNIHTGGAVTVNDLVIADGWGHPHLAQARERTCVNERYPSPIGLGLWTDGRYVVEHWVPTISWAPTDEIHWHAKEVAYILDQLVSAKADAEDIAGNPHKHSCAHTNYGLRISEVRAYSQRVREIRAQMEAFAQQHGLVITPDLLNGTRFRRAVAQNTRSSEAPRVEQMMLI